MTRRWARSAIALLTLAGSLSRGYAGDFSSSAKGTTSGQFLQLGAGARPGALGEAYSAVADDAGALYWNPAALTRVQGGSLLFMHAPYVESSFYDYAAIARDLGSWGAVGLGGQFFSAGQIAQTDAAGNSLGNFNPQDMALSLGYAHALGGASVGVSGKFIRSTILNTAQTEALDVGLLSPAYWQDRIRLAAVAANLGGKLKYEQEGADLPRTLRLGGACQFSRSFLVSLDAVATQSNAPYAALGTEYSVSLSREMRGALRAGFNTRSVSDLGGFHSVSMGLGLAFKALSVDYALAPMGELGLTHRISLSMRWGARERETQARRPVEEPAGELAHDPGRPKQREIRFQYRDVNAKQVAIAGDFNHWTAEPMRKKEGGLWVLAKELRYGVYQYKLWVDGRQVTDPNTNDRNREIVVTDSESEAPGAPGGR